MDGAAAERWPENANVAACLVILASDASERNEHEEALDLLRRSENAGPIDDVMVSRVRLAAGDFEGAHAYLKTIIDGWDGKDYRAVELVGELAYLEFAQGDFEQARKHLEKVAPLCEIPHGDGGPCALVYALQAQGHRRLGDFDAVQRFAALGRSEFAKAEGIPFERRKEVAAWLQPAEGGR